MESVKDQSLVKGLSVSVALLVGHPLFYWIWSSLEPQPYESLWWRAASSVLGGAALYTIRRYGASDTRAAVTYGMCTAVGTVVLASWFYVANGGNKVWLASLVSMTMVYFSLTDWRLAVAVTLTSFVLSALLVPTFGIGVWAAGQAGSYPVFDTDAVIILAFSFGVSVLTRYTDTSMRIVQMRSQLRALGIAAHEIRSPLAQVQLLSSALEQNLGGLRAGPIGERVLAHLQLLATELRQACVDANGLIDTTLANSNPFKPFPRRDLVSMRAAVAEAVTTFQRSAGIKEAPAVVVEIRHDFGILADQSTLQQVLINLLKNAMKAVVQRHKAAVPEQIFVTVDFGKRGTVAVADLGVGMTPTELARAFEPFYTGDELHGHGLGLTFCAAAVQAYGGRLHVESEKGCGTTVTIEFPEAAPYEPEIPVRADPQEGDLRR